MTNVKPSHPATDGWVFEFLAGAGVHVGPSAPARPRSPKKGASLMSQLRPTFSRRRKMITGNRNSGEEPVRRRKAPAPIRFAFAGAGERTILPPPTSPRSSEDSLRFRPQLRPTFSRRRKSDYRNPNSGERPVPRRKAPPPVKVVLAGAGERTILPAPPSPRSSEDSFRFRAQLRPAFARRRKSDYRQPNSGERPIRRRKAPPPVRGFLAGASERTILPAPPSSRSSEDSLRIRPQLRPTFSHRRTASASAPNSGQRTPAGGEQITGDPTPARDPFPGGKPQPR